MLTAISNPQLKLAEALKVAQMPGNQAIIRKLREFKVDASETSFAEAIYETAHGRNVTDTVSKDYFLGIVKANAAVIASLIKRIDADPAGFQGAIEKRISVFAPKNSDIHLRGYVIAGGDGGGYAFGGTDFYLNVGLVRDFILARAVTNHERYHAVQGSFIAQRHVMVGDPDRSACAATQKLLENVYEEGTAVYVEDQTLVAESKSDAASRKRVDMADGLKHIDFGVSLLEMSVDAFRSKPPISYDKVYDVGFYGHGTLYSVGYVIARDLVEQSGPSALTRLLSRPAYDFVLDYVNLPKYGVDTDHPLLGSNTVAAARAMVAGCK